MSKMPDKNEKADVDTMSDGCPTTFKKGKAPSRAETVQPIATYDMAYFLAKAKQYASNPWSKDEWTRICKNCHQTYGSHHGRDGAKCSNTITYFEIDEKATAFFMAYYAFIKSILPLLNKQNEDKQAIN